MVIRLRVSADTTIFCWRCRCWQILIFWSG